MLKRNTREPAFLEEAPYANQTAEPQPEDIYHRPIAAPQGSEAPDETRSRVPGKNPESVIDAHSTFDGRYETAHDLRIEGLVSGQIVCRGLLTIERDATVKAKLEANDACIRGRLEGDIVCSGKLELAATAAVVGTLRAGALVIQEGAALSGTIQTGAVAAEAPGAPKAPGGRNGRSRAVPSFSFTPAEPERVARE